MEAVIVIGKNIVLNKYNLDSKMLIGVEKGAYLLANSKYNDFISFGDFDSVSNRELDLICKKSKKVIKLNPIKDDTDTYGAYLLCKDCSKITILGGISGKRIEHLIANINLVKKDNRVELLDDDCYIKALQKGIYYFNNDYYFYSFYAIEEANIDIQGDFRYKLESYDLKPLDSLCVSNQIDGKLGKLVINSGSVLLICSKNDA